MLRFCELQQERFFQLTMPFLCAAENSIDVKYLFDNFFSEIVETQSSKKNFQDVNFTGLLRLWFEFSTVKLNREFIFSKSKAVLH